MIHDINPITIVIKSGQTKSNPFYVGNASSLGVIFPATMTSATITMEVSHHPTGFFVPFDPDNSVFAAPIAVVPGVGVEFAIGFAPIPFPFMKLVANIAEAADRTLIVVGKG